MLGSATEVGLKDQTRKRARRRALRAAQVVTIALAMGTGGCSTRDAVPTTDAGRVARDAGSMGVDAAMEDAGTSPEDAGAEVDAFVADAGPLADDAGPLADAGPDAGPDAGAIAMDAGALDCFGGLITTQADCEACGFLWDESSARCLMAVPGPFVPPAMA